MIKEQHGFFLGEIWWASNVFTSEPQQGAPQISHELMPQKIQPHKITKHTTLFLGLSNFRKTITFRWVIDRKKELKKYKVYWILYLPNRKLLNGQLDRNFSYHSFYGVRWDPSTIPTNFYLLLALARKLP